MGLEGVLGQCRKVQFGCVGALNCGSIRLGYLDAVLCFLFVDAGCIGGEEMSSAS